MYIRIFLYNYVHTYMIQIHVIALNFSVVTWWRFKNLSLNRDVLYLIIFWIKTILESLKFALNIKIKDYNIKTD